MSSVEEGAICGKPVHGDFGAPCTYPPNHAQWWHQHDGTLMPHSVPPGKPDQSERLTP